MAAHIVVERTALAQRHADQRTLRLLRRLADRLWYFARLAGAVTDAAAAIADDDQRGKAEAPAALHHLGDAIDADELFDQLGFFPIPRTLAIAIPFAAFTSGSFGHASTL